MGTLLRFHCDACGYSVETFGADDVTFAGRVKPVICRDCRTIEVVVLETGPDTPPFQPGDSAPLPDAARCRRCDGANIEAWPTDHPCPRCGAAMGEGEFRGIAD